MLWKTLYNDKFHNVPRKNNFYKNYKNCYVLNNFLLKYVKKDINYVIGLQKLEFDFRKSYLLEEIGLLCNLQSLSMSDCNIQTLPRLIGQLKNLSVLNVANNKLSFIPETIGQLTNLHTLRLHHNKLEYVPDDIGQLVNLRTLTLACNKLQTIPDTVGQLSELNFVTLYGNPLVYIPSTLIVSNVIYVDDKIVHLLSENTKRSAIVLHFT
jgi:Leucine-rich repeat (LRR) protein